VQKAGQIEVQFNTREIASCQQQYEYYRDLLLSFPKPEGVAA
jgi:hypothetical protein